MSEWGTATRDPVWAQGLALLLLAAGLTPADAGPAAAPDTDRAQAPALATATARELRGVPGLGERRALALVDARWRRGSADPPLYLGEVPGIGPASEAAVAAWLDAWAR